MMANVKPPNPFKEHPVMMLSELKESNLSVDHASRILEVVDDVAMEINAMEIDDPEVTFNDVVRMFAEDTAEIDRWLAC